MLAYLFGWRSAAVDPINADIGGQPAYANNHLGEVHEGVSFFVAGRITNRGERFLIDFGLENAAGDIAIRIAAHVLQKVVGRNTRIKGTWGKLERDSINPVTLEQGDDFKIQILFTVEAIMVAVNGLHIASYVHRLPFHEILTLEIKGDVTAIRVHRRIVTNYPERSPKTQHVVHLNDERPFQHDFSADFPNFNNFTTYLPLPYYAMFPRGLYELGYSITVQGQIKAVPKVIRIQLRSGQYIWPQPIVALQVELRFNKYGTLDYGEPILARNSFTLGKWNQEITGNNQETGLRPGANMNLSIVRGHTELEIIVNEKPITTYPLKVNAKYLDTVMVAGDLNLFNIEIESD